MCCKFACEAHLRLGGMAHTALCISSQVDQVASMLTLLLTLTPSVSFTLLLSVNLGIASHAQNVKVPSFPTHPHTPTCFRKPDLQSWEWRSTRCLPHTSTRPQTGSGASTLTACTRTTCAKSLLLHLTITLASGESSLAAPSPSQALSARDGTCRLLLRPAAAPFLRIWPRRTTPWQVIW